MAAAASGEASFSSLQCAVCGDSASAFNFGALSCESCKAFFRRAAQSNKVKLCVFSGHCTVSLQTRRFCAACRLRKCYAAGMDKRHVLSER